MDPLALFLQHPDYNEILIDEVAQRLAKGPVAEGRFPHVEGQVVDPALIVLKDLDPPVTLQVLQIPGLDIRPVVIDVALLQGQDG